MLRRPFAWLMAMMGALIALLTAIHLVQIPLRIPLNYNEGWMALLSDRAVGGGVLYPAPGLFVVDNYPPLSFYVIGAVGRLLGDNVAAGRCVALAALAAVTCEVLWSARRLDAGKGAAALGALLFALSNLTWFHAYVAMADPQWLGQAVTLAGLPLLLQAGDGRLRLGPVIASAVLMTAGGFIKHNLIALPLATALWLAVEDRRAFLAWSATAVVALGAGALLVARVYGPDAFVGVLGHHRRMLPGQWPDALVYLLPMLPMIAAALWLIRRRGRDRRVRLAAGFAAAAVPLALLQRLGDGINVNAYFEALAALSICAGAAVAEGPFVWRGRAYSAAAAAFALAAPMLLAAPYFLGQGIFDLVRSPARQAAWAQVIAAAAGTPGPVACEMLSVCYWAGKDFELDFFNYGQALRAGGSAAPLGKIIADGRFGAMVLTRDAAFLQGEGRLPAPIPARIEAAYAVRLSGPRGTVLMTPRRP